MTDAISRAMLPDNWRGLCTHELRVGHLRRFRALFLVLGVLLGSSSAVHAATATWNANTETDIAGYILSYGTSPGVHPTSVDVKNVTTWQITTLTPGQIYYFVVQAYNTSAMTSVASAEVAFTVPAGTPPSLTSLNPTSGVPGASVTIAGATFGATQGTSTVTFNGTAATPTSWSASSIVVPVPAAAATGPVVVTVGGMSSNGITFTVTMPAPTLTSLNPTAGAVGSAVTIAGANFGATQGTSTVTFNATAATPTGWTASSIVVPVPAAATTGPVVVTVGGLASNGISFTVSASAPTLTSLTPTSGAVGSAVTIAGTNFGATQGTSTVKFNATAATPTSWTASSIVVPVPASATTGPVVVTVGGLASNSITFTVTAGSAPSLTGLNPSMAPAGTPVTIAGAGFGATQGTSTVTFNGIAATPTSWSDTSLLVPSGATTGNVVVTVAGQASAGVSFTVNPTWTAQDIGGPALAGHATVASGTFTVSGAGADIYGVNDQFQFVYQPLNGDGEVVALVSSLQATDGWAKAGVMIRQDLTGGATNALSAVTVGNGLTFQERVAQNGTTTYINGFPGVVPYWVRLVRSGNTFSGYYSTTGTAWILMASRTVTMTAQAYVGLAVTSHNPALVTTAALSNVTIIGPAPTLTSLTPTSGPVGSAVTIAGANFGTSQGTSTVGFSGTLATATTWSGTSITVPVPGNATTGPVVVTVGSMASNGISFTVTVPAPTLTSLTPTSGVVGSAVTIAGASFGTSQGTSTVKFNGIAATPTAWSGTSITAPVPGTATSGPVVVTVGGLASNGISFTVTPPAPGLTSLTPTSGAVGSAVTIAGANFGTPQGASTVKFNGITATPTAWSTTSISVPVPSGATTGPVVVTVGGVASNGISFTVVPVSGSITLTQHRNIDTAGASAGLAFASNNAAGNFIAVAVRAFLANQTITVSDSRGNIYRQAVTFNNNADDTLAIYYAQNIAAGANTVTVAVSTAPVSIRFAIFEYSGVAISNALDVIATNTLSSVSPNSGNATTTANGDLLIGVFATQSTRTYTAGSGYTIEEAVSAAPSTALMVEDTTQATAGTVSAPASLDSSDLWGAGLAAFKKAFSGPATLTYPVNGAANVDMTLPMQWTTAAGAQAYYLYVGLILGTNDLVNTGEIQQTSYLATGLPGNQKVFARLWTKLGGAWLFSDSSFTTAPTVPVVATLTSPVNGATNVDTTLPMQWTTIAGVQAYSLYVGSTQGASNLLYTGEIQQTSYPATGLPGGQTVFARLWTEVGSVWRFSDSSFTTAPTAAVIATLTYPVNGATNADMTLPMQWTTIAGAQAYYLYVGSTVGANDLVNTGEIQQTSYLAAGLPHSQTVFARLWTEVGGVWRFSDSSFTTAP